MRRQRPGGVSQPHLSGGGGRQDVAVDGQAVALLQDLPDLLVEPDRDPVDGPVQPASPQPLTLSLLPVELPVSWTVSHRGQDPTGGGGAAAALR